MFNVGTVFEGLSRASMFVAWLSIALLLVATHSCAVGVGWHLKGNAVAAEQLEAVREQAAADVEAVQQSAAIDTAVLVDKAHGDAQAPPLFRQMREEVIHAVREPEPALPGDPVVRECGLDAAARGVWNQALQATVPAAAAGAARGSAGTGAAAPEPDTGAITRLADVVLNHVDNAEVNAANRRQCEALFAWHRLHLERGR